MGIFSASAIGCMINVYPYTMTTSHGSVQRSSDIGYFQLLLGLHNVIGNLRILKFYLLKWFMVANSFNSFISFLQIGEKWRKIRELPSLLDPKVKR